MQKQNAWRLDGEEVKEPIHYPDCGLDDVYLLNGYECHQTAYGEGIAVKDLDGLRQAIALHLAEHKKLLTGKEIRFLRKQIDLSQSELGRLLGVDTQTVARWEKGECRMPGPADRMLRLLCLEHEEQRMDLRELLRHLDEVDSQITDRQVFEETKDGWRSAA